MNFSATSSLIRNVFFKRHIDLEATNENTMSNVTLYPNPNKGQFTLSLPEEDCDITICNSLGQVVHHTTAKGLTTLSLDNLSDGVYFVNVKSESVVRTLKFVRE